MSDDDLGFLQPGFDLSSLTVPKLRSILVSYDIPYPASAKKPQLIQLMQTELLPKAKRILNARSKTKASARGIVDVPSSQESTQESTQDESDRGELMPPPPVPRTPSRGRKKRNTDVVPTTETEEEAPRTTRKTPGRRSTAKHARASSTETETHTDTSIRPSARKSRKSQAGTTPVVDAAAPHVKITEPDLAIKREFADADESPFSNDNPFQSGSSPSSRDRRRSKDMKRRSAGTSSVDRRKSSSRQRQTTSPPTTVPIKQEDGIAVPSRKTFEFPISRFQQPEPEAPKIKEEDIQPSEEFTPEAQLELVRDRAAEGYSSRDMIPSRKSRRRQTNSAVKTLPWTLLLLLTTYFAYYWRGEKIEIGYCGVGKPTWSITHSTAKLPQWVNDALQPTCEPCPQHAYCYPNFEARCDKDFVLQPHPLSLGGLVPLPPTCEPDSEKLRKMTSVANRAIEELRERKAKYECGEPLANDKPEERQMPATVEIAEEELKKEVSKKRRKGMSQEEFEDLWMGALGEIIGREEVISSGDGILRPRTLSTTSLARLPATCLLRLRLRAALLQHRLFILLLTFTLSAIIYARSLVRSRRSAAARVPQLVDVALDRLATQAAVAAASSSGDGKEGWLSIGQLRDDVLRSELSGGARERAWRGVKDVVEGNANVRVGVREDARSGEVMRVWEWIGPVGALPPSSSSGSRGASPHGGGGGVEMIEKGRDSRRWDEGRPAF